MKRHIVYTMLIVMAFCSSAILCGCPAQPAGEPTPAITQTPRAGATPAQSPALELKPEDITDHAFWEAVNNNDVAKAKALLEKKPEYVKLADSNKNTPLHIAAIEDRIQLIEVLVQKGANVNAQNMEGRTPLHEARTGGAASMIVAKGANLTLKDKKGKTALEHAQLEKYNDVVMVIKGKK